MGKLLTINPEEEYRKMMGEEAYLRQKHLANVEAGRCSCTPRPMKRKWGGAERLTMRSVHDRDCAKFKPWMEEAYL